MRTEGGCVEPVIANVLRDRDREAHPPEPSHNSSAGGVLLAADDVQRYVRLVADDPTVMSGWHIEEIPCPHHHLAAVIHLRDRLAAQHEPDVLDLARALSGPRPHVLGPLPAWLIGRPAEGGRSDAVELELALLECPHLARLVEVHELRVHRR